jgi:hypothetical protein
MKRARQHDLFVRDCALTALDAPAMFHRELELPDSVPFPPILDEGTERTLRAIVALGDVPPGKALSALRRAVRQTQAAVDTLKATMKIAAIFDDLAFTKAELETMPDGYRQALIAQRRRPHLKVVSAEAP